MQLRALDEVTALAIEDPYVREVFAGFICDSYLAPKYKETELYISSAKALVSIKDIEVYEFWSRYNLRPSTLNAREFEKELMGYLRCFLLGSKAPKDGSI